MKHSCTLIWCWFLYFRIVEADLHLILCLLLKVGVYKSLDSFSFCESPKSKYRHSFHKRSLIIWMCLLFSSRWKFQLIQSSRTVVWWHLLQCLEILQRKELLNWIFFMIKFGTSTICLSCLTIFNYDLFLSYQWHDLFLQNKAIYGVMTDDAVKFTMHKIIDFIGFFRPLWLGSAMTSLVSSSSSRIASLERYTHSLVTPSR